MDDGTVTDNGLTVSHDTTTARTVVYLVVGTREEWEAMEAAEQVTGLVAEHADPDTTGWFDDEGGAFTVTLWRR